MTNRLLGMAPDQITESEKVEELEKFRQKRIALLDGEERTDEMWKKIQKINAEEEEFDNQYPDLPPEEVIVVYNLKEECHGCLTSWTGETKDGEEVYARYRSGCLSVSVGDEVIFGKQLDKGETPEEYAKTVEEQNVFTDPKTKEAIIESHRNMCKVFGPRISYDGMLSVKQLVEATKDWFVWSL